MVKIEDLKMVRQRIAGQSWFESSMPNRFLVKANQILSLQRQYLPLCNLIRLLS